MARSGERVALGDMVLASEAGEVKRVFLRQMGRPLGVDGEGRLLVSCGDRERDVGYWCLYDATGTRLSRTRKIVRELQGLIQMGQKYKAGPEGGYYEFYLDRAGVYVSFWSEGNE